MCGFAFALAVPPWALGVAIVVLVVVAGVAVLRLIDSADPQAGTAGADEEVVCPRCHHRNPADATRCPECGRSM